MIAGAAGCKTLTIADPQGSGPIRCHLLYPSHLPASTRMFGLYPVDVAMNAPLPAMPCPQVLISHGNGGSPWTHRDLAVDLARHGWLVILPEHSGNCVGDNRLAGTLANLVNRPRQLSLALDAITRTPELRACALGDGVAVIGHSLGGYTALAAAGGLALAGAHETPDGQPQAIPVRMDPRIDRLLLLAPAAARFGSVGALRGVKASILIWAAELDTLTPPAEAEMVRRATAPGQTRLQVIPGAGHFSFLSPFPAKLDRPGFAPAQDPPGFDRRALQPLLHEAVHQFLAGDASALV